MQVEYVNVSAADRIRDAGERRYLKPIDGVNALQETWKTHTPGVFPTITLHSFDAELQTDVKTELQIIQQGAAAYVPSSNLVLDWEDRKIDSVHSSRIVNFVSALPPSYVIATTQQFTFPSILSYLSFALVQLAAAGRKEPQWTAGIRASFTIPTLLITTVEFFPSDWLPTAGGVLYNWRPTDIIFKGISYSLNINNVLTDAWSNIGVTYAADTYYGNTVDRFSISATNPSATSYVNAIGTLQTVSVTIERYKHMYMRKTTQVYLQ